MRKSITKRIKVTKTGKIKRRVPGLSHAHANKSRRELLHKKEMRGLNLPKKKIRQYL